MNANDIMTLAWEFVITYKWWFIALSPFAIAIIVLKMASPR